MKYLINPMFALAGILAASQALAFPSARTDITIYDGDSTSEVWHGAAEDGEVEPGMQHGQVWDMEGFFLETGSGNLGMVSGFNFRDGYGGFTAGDIFIDVNGDHIPGNATTSSHGYSTLSATTFGYDIVLNVDWTSIDSNGVGTYDVILLDANALVTKPYYRQNFGSGPFEYVSGGTLLESGTFQFEEGLTDAETGFLGGSHYAASGFDIGFLDGYGEWWVSNAMGCGNDHLLGYHQADVPETSSVLLLLSGVLALGWARRRVRH